MKPLWWISRVVEDTRLDADARALLIWFGTRRGGWQYEQGHAQFAMGFGRQKYFRVLASLKSDGWILAEHKRDKKTGQIVHTKVIVRDAAAPVCRKSSHGDDEPCDDFKETGRSAENHHRLLIDNGRVRRPSQTGNVQRSLRVVGGRDV